jgi:lycopene epsilon-cyclase
MIHLSCLSHCSTQHLLQAFLPEYGNQVSHDAGNDVPFVNNYGVWVDEFRDLGLEKNLNRIWQDALCYFGEDKEVRIGRQYGRVCRRKLRKHLLQRCQTNGVQFMAGMMDELETEQTSDTATIRLADGQVVRSR